MRSRTPFVAEEQALHWAATMLARAPNGDADAAPQPALTVKAVTHECDGCEDGAPCTSCGGNVALGSPAYSALQWALTGTSEFSDPFWRTAAVLHSVRDAPDRSPESAEWTAIENVVSAGHDLYVAMTQGNGAGESAARVSQGLSHSTARAQAITSGDDERVYATAGFEYATLVNNSPTLEMMAGGGSVCCPTLIYPIPSPKPGKQRVGLRWELYTEFEVLVVYSADPPCSCGCCVFRQYIDASVNGTGGGPDGRPLPYHPPPGEDVDKKGGRFGHKGQSPSCANWAQPASCEDYSIAGLSPAATAAMNQVVKDKGIKSFCIYYMRDYPGIVVNPGESKSRNDCFLGVVKSRCPPCPIVKIDSFALSRSGSVDGSGNLTSDSSSGGTATSLGGASCSLPPAGANDC